MFCTDSGVQGPVATVSAVSGECSLVPTQECEDLAQLQLVGQRMESEL